MMQSNGLTTHYVKITGILSKLLLVGVIYATAIELLLQTRSAMLTAHFGIFATVLSSIVQQNK
jgi:hypothetical protein